ncbi:hypothetical protein ACFLTE_05435 [Bacteroidota bacterium]
MEESFLHKVYQIFNNVIHLNDLNILSHSDKKHPFVKRCPVTGLDISMQPKNSKFLSYTGVKWYYEHDYKTYLKVLASRIQQNWLEKNIEYQFKEIAHNIRNSDSNPRNNTKRAINKIIDDDNCLFNNLELIDKNKLKEAGMM